MANPAPAAARRRATLNEMRDAALRTDYTVGTDAHGNIVSIGTWNWPREYAVPDAPPLATVAEKRDIRTASGMTARKLPETVFAAFLAARRAIAEAATGEAGLRADGYSGKALQDALPKLGAQVRDVIDNHAAEAHRASIVVDEVLGEVGAVRVDHDQGDDEAARTRRELVLAVQDIAIVQSLAALSPVESALLIERRQLPKRLDDLRVLDALRAAPRALTPFTDDELAAILEMGVAKRWPHTVRVATNLREALVEVQRVSATAIAMCGRLLHPSEPVRVFSEIPGGLWAAVALAAREDYRDPLGPQLRELLRPYQMEPRSRSPLWGKWGGLSGAPPAPASRAPVTQ